MNTKRKVLLWITLTVIAAIVGIAAVCGQRERINENPEQDVEQNVFAEGSEAVPSQDSGETEEPELLLRDFGNGLVVTELGSYSGRYVEDGSDEEVSGILMLKLRNSGEEAVEYAAFQMMVNEEAAEFSVSALMPGAEVILLEKNRMAYDSSVDYEITQMQCVNFALYQRELELYEDVFRIQMLDGAVNVINVSETEITGDIAIYYKNKENGTYLGGIAYRIMIEGGVGVGEVRQKMASHISSEMSEILFVTIAE